MLRMSAIALYPTKSENKVSPAPFYEKEQEMAGGWTRDGAVQDQIDDTVKDASRGGAPCGCPRGRAPRNATIAASPSPSRPEQGACRVAAHLRVACTSRKERDKTDGHSAINRRGSKRQPAPVMLIVDTIVKRPRYARR